MAKPKFNLNVEKTRSGYEATILKGLSETGVPYEYEKHKLSYVKYANYIPDLKIGNIFIELKGFFLTADMAKMVAVQESNPKADIRMVFQNAYGAVQGAKIRKKTGTKMTCWEWCEAHGFKWANKVIPQEWITEALKI